MDLKILGIFPKKNKEKKHLEEGTVHIFFGAWNLKIENIPYQINKDKSIVVDCPKVFHIQDPEDKTNKITFAPFTSFKDNVKWIDMITIIKQAILVNFKKSLARRKRDCKKNCINEK